MILSMTWSVYNGPYNNSKLVIYLIFGLFEAFFLMQNAFLLFEAFKHGKKFFVSKRNLNSEKNDPHQNK